MSSRPPVPLLLTLEGLRFLASIGIASEHMLPHAGVTPPAGFDLLVDIFFVISGIVIGTLYAGAINDWRDYGLFMRRRLARIYPLHLATLLFYVIVGIGVAWLKLEVDDPRRYAASGIPPNLLLVQAWFPSGGLSFNFVSWSISAEFFAYLAMPVVAAAMIRHRQFGLLVIGVSLAGGIAFAERSMHAHLFALRWNGALPRILPSFAFGVWLSVHGAGAAGSLRRLNMAIVFTVAACLVAAAVAAGLSGYVVLGLSYILVASGYFCDLEGRPTFASWRVLSSQGYLTYSIYMLHVPVTTLFISFLAPRIIGQSVLAQGLAVALAVPLLFAIAILSFRYFEDPLRRALR